MLWNTDLNWLPDYYIRFAGFNVKWLMEQRDLIFYDDYLYYNNLICIGVYSKGIPSGLHPFYHNLLFV